MLLLVCETKACFIIPFFVILAKYCFYFVSFFAVNTVSFGRGISLWTYFSSFFLTCLQMLHFHWSILKLSIKSAVKFEGDFVTLF